MIYLDNAATSFPKPKETIYYMNSCIKNFCANPGRSGHSFSLKCARYISSARQSISGFFGIKDPMRLCFTKNATEALNIAIYGIIKYEYCHVITTSLEHNSVLRPLHTLKKNGIIDLDIVYSDDKGYIDINNIKKLLKPKTKLIVCTIASNVNGIILPYKEIARLSKENNILFLLDASQGAGHIDIGVEKDNIELMAFPGHKGLLGPQGTGGLYISDSISLEPLMQGGTGSNSENLLQPEFYPDVLESGTLNAPGIMGLLGGIRYIDKVGLRTIINHKNALIKHLDSNIRKIKKVKVYSPEDPEINSGIVAFNIYDMDSNETAYILDKKYNIACRAGLHCAPLAHKTFGTSNQGIVRLSIGCFNTMEEINETILSVEKIAYGEKS